MSAEPLTNVVDLVPDSTMKAKPDNALTKSKNEVYRLVKDSIDLVGGMDVASEICGIDRGDLRRALDKAGRYLAVDHVMAFTERLVLFNPETAQKIAAAIVRPSDMLVFPRVQITAAERARRLENMLRRMPHGDVLVREALETP
jgi:hypothetical protein